MNTKELINKVCSQNPVKANILTLSVLNYKHSAAPPHNKSVSSFIEKPK